MQQSSDTANKAWRREMFWNHLCRSTHTVFCLYRSRASWATTSENLGSVQGISPGTVKLISGSSNSLTDTLVSLGFSGVSVSLQMIFMKAEDGITSNVDMTLIESEVRWHRCRDSPFGFWRCPRHWSCGWRARTPSWTDSSVYPAASRYWTSPPQSSSGGCCTPLWISRPKPEPVPGPFWVDLPEVSSRNSLDKRTMFSIGIEGCGKM